MANSDVFNTQLEYIKDEQLRTEVKKILDEVPEIFYHAPASSSGKYHPSYALGEGGLIRHTIAACEILHDILNLDGFSFSNICDDWAYAAIILHDSFKYGLDGKSEHTIFEHPIVAADYVREHMDYAYKWDIAKMIETHMGQWTESKYSEIKLREPRTHYELLVHLADYLASRKHLEFNFNI